MSKPRYNGEYMRLTLTPKNKDKKVRTVVGAAFPNPFGGYNLVLHPGIVLTSDLLEKYYLSMNPRYPDYPGSQGSKEPTTSGAESDDDIPF